MGPNGGPGSWNPGYWGLAFTGWVTLQHVMLLERCLYVALQAVAALQTRSAPGEQATVVLGNESQCAELAEQLRAAQRRLQLLADIRELNEAAGWGLRPDILHEPQSVFSTELLPHERKGLECVAGLLGVSLEPGEPGPAEWEQLSYLLIESPGVPRV